MKTGEFERKFKYIYHRSPRTESLSGTKMHPKLFHTFSLVKSLFNDRCILARSSLIQIRLNLLSLGLRLFEINSPTYFQSISLVTCYPLVIKLEIWEWCLIPRLVYLLRLVLSVVQVTTISTILLELDVTSINLQQLQYQMSSLVVGLTIVTHS